MPEDMVGTAEIAAMLGVTVGRVWQLRQRPDFPEPAVRLRGAFVWRTADVVRWAEERGREIRE
jgi:prophage regulatory protein